MTDSLTNLSLHETSELLEKCETSSVELTNAYFEAIAARASLLGCYLTLTHDLALKQAKAADQRRAKNDNVTSLTGIPIALKDIFVTQGIKTTCASKILENYIPPYSATTWHKLENAGAVLLGKLNMDEFAMGSTNEQSAFYPVKNPWDVTRIPGGSSGGSAAAVAANLCVASLGTDTGGSIRQPASMCGVVGLKPTYGRVSRYGIIAFASSLDQVGPITKRVRDAALLMNVIAGHDPQDATSCNVPIPDYTANLEKGIRGMKLGLPKEYFIKGMDGEVEACVKQAITQLEHLGASIEEISLPHTEYAIPCYYILAPAEASSNLARYDGIRYGVRHKDGDDLVELYQKTRTAGFGPEVTLRIIIGTHVLSSGYYDAYYLKAQKVRTLIKNDFLEAFTKVDAIVTPTTPTPAFPLGSKDENPVTMYLNDIFTCPVNLASLPGLSLPCGFSRAGLPIGLQLIGKPLDEATLLRLGHTYEQSTEWHQRRP